MKDTPDGLWLIALGACAFAFVSSIIYGKWKHNSWMAGLFVIIVAAMSVFHKAKSVARKIKNTQNYLGGDKR